MAENSEQEDVLNSPENKEGPGNQTSRQEEDEGVLNSLVTTDPALFSFPTTFIHSATISSAATIPIRELAHTLITSNRSAQNAAVHTLLNTQSTTPPPSNTSETSQQKDAKILPKSQQKKREDRADRKKEKRKEAREKKKRKEQEDKIQKDTETAERKRENTEKKKQPRLTSLERKKHPPLLTPTPLLLI
jgi:hypothetical protein